jgi:hypothetical protein
MNTSRLSSISDDPNPMLIGVPRLLGYGGVAAVTGSLASSTVSDHYHDSIACGRWRYAPQPDFILLRGHGRPALPGWMQSTVESWWRWSTVTVSFGVRQAYSLPAPSRLALPDDGLPDMLDDVPRLLGYGAVAELTPRRGAGNRVIVGDDGHAVPLASSTISSYFYDSIDRGSWVYVPRPDFILVRGAGRPALQGWSLRSIEDWQATRPGAGNRTRGPMRRGGGSTSSRRSSDVA